MAEYYAEIKDQLREALGRRRLNERLWKDLVHSGYVPALSRGKGSITELARVYWRKEEDLFPERKQRRRTVAEARPDRRAAVLAEILALRAAKVWGVEAFRSRVLGGKLLAAEEVAAWVEAQAKREGPPAEGYLSLPLDWPAMESWLAGVEDGTSLGAWLAQQAERVADRPDVELPERFTRGPTSLDYAGPDGRRRSVLIRGDRLLAELKGLASGWLSVGSQTGWPEHHAVAFILAGVVPSLVKARVGVRYGACPAANTIELQSSPRLTAAQVARLYGKAREQFVGGADRPMDDKHLALAVFAERTMNDGSTWCERRRRWNEEYPEWRFADRKDFYARRFALEARTAWGRVTGQDWPQRRRKVQRGSQAWRREG